MKSSKRFLTRLSILKRYCSQGEGGVFTSCNSMQNYLGLQTTLRSRNLLQYLNHQLRLDLITEKVLFFPVQFHICHKVLNRHKNLPFLANFVRMDASNSIVTLIERSESDALH